MNKNLLFPQLLMEAYAAGIFPMGMPDGEICWYSPDPRGILPLVQFHTPHGVKRSLKKVTRREWQIRIDTCFFEVVHSCAARDDTWITPLIANSYSQLFQCGYAHSVEVWRDEELLGGLYGVALGGAFFGESMFHRETDASKVALCYLATILRSGGFTLLDAQWITPHLAQFGGVEIPREAYLSMLAQAIGQKALFPPPGRLS